MTSPTKFKLTTGFFLGFAQILLSVLFIGAFFYTLNKFLPEPDKLDPAAALEIAKTLLAVLTGSVVTIVAFWFSRSRSETMKNHDTIIEPIQEEPEPTPTIVEAEPAPTEEVK